MRWSGRGSRAELVARLYDEHGAALFRYALMLLADHSAAEDALQQVFAAVMRPRTQVDHPAHYLRRAVRNECYSVLRRRTREPQISEPLLEPVLPQAVSADERIALERAIVQLPPEQREVIHLHVFEGMTFQEVADATEESINTAASRYRYAIEKLRTLLA